jgi:hypothetical protein
MSPQARVSLFVAGLAVVLVAGFGIGSLVEPAETESGAAHGEMAQHSEEESEMSEHGSEQSEHGTGQGDRQGAHGEHQAEATTPTGLAVAAGGYSLRLQQSFAATGEAGELRFRIEDADGEPVRDYDRLHEREMHLIVVRRDGAHFQHLHPELDAAGTWSTPLTLPAAGVYRVFADFAAGGEDHTLAADLSAAGSFDPQPFPAPALVDAVAGYEVRLADATPRAGEASPLRFAVSRDGAAVTDLESYLGAKGHLVALREGDLAFLHVHPEQTDEASVIPFAAHFPTPGRYRLYLQFKHQGQVRTVEFTVEVER